MAKVQTGEFFARYPLAYAPLCLVTLPMEGWLKSGLGESDIGVFVYALIACVVYFCVSLVVLLPVLISRKRRMP